MPEHQHSSRTMAPVVIWPPDDTEESVLGTDLHQESITNLRLGLNELAAALTLPGQPPPWHAHSQTEITGLERWDGSAYIVLPDVFVYRQPIDKRRARCALATDGPPLLVIEVLSPTTAAANLDVLRGKGYSYARAGVREYLTVDPTGEFVTERGRGWRLRDGRYAPWLPETNGRWQSQELPVAIAVEGLLIAVYGPDGQRQLREGEINRELARERAELARKDAEIAELRRQLEQLRQRE